MQEWILAHKFSLIVIILMDGLVLTYLGAQHKKNTGACDPGLHYFWQLCKQGDAEGIVACALSLLALIAGLLLGSTLL